MSAMQAVIPKRLFVRTTLSCLFLLAFSNLKAQEESFFFHKLSADHNLTAQRFNFFVLKDREGYIWIPSIYGLNRYDGREVKQFLPDEQDSLMLEDGLIQSRLFEGRNGEIWFSTSEALHIYNRNQDHFQRKHFEIDNKKIKGRWHLVHYDSLLAECWVLFEKRLLVFPLDTLQEPIAVDATSGLYGYGIQMIANATSKNKYLLMPKSNGWEIYNYKDYKRVKKYKFPSVSKPGFRTSSFLFENEKLLWVGTDTGLIACSLGRSGANFKIYNEYNGKLIDGVSSIASADDNTLIIATYTKGLYFFDKSSLKFTSKIYSNDGLGIIPFEPNIDQLFVDKDKNLWISTDGQGVFYANLEKRRFKSILQNKLKDSIQLGYIQGITEDDNGRLWCLTKKGILVVNKDGTLVPGFERFQKRNLPYVGKTPFHIFKDTQGWIWICVQQGLFVLKDQNKSFESVEFRPGGSKRGPLVINLSELSNGRLLASTYNSGIYEIRKSNNNIYFHPLKELPNRSNTYSKIYEDTIHKKVFISNEMKSLMVFHFEEDSLKLDTSILLKPLVNAFLTDKRKDKLWIATASGLFYLNLHNDAYKLVKDTIFSFKPIKALLQDSLGNLWASLNNGLVRYTPDLASWTKYRLSDGLQSLEFNFWSSLENRNGDFIFGGVNGLNLFNPYQIKDVQIQATPVIANILINDQVSPNLSCDITQARNINQIRKITLPFSQNTLSFSFAALEYSDPKANQFQYQMVGIDDTLVYFGENAFARYANLPAKEYIFNVRATNSDGVWSERIASLVITILPPWYQTWWFRTIMVLALIGIIYSYYRFRINQEATRRKEAEYKQLIAETETAVLRLQMNPHFIFNSLNSISSYLLQRDVDTANDYLIRFSKLIRKILFLAEKPFISISEEMNLLEQYLKTEAMRLEKKFDYSIEVSTQLDPDDYLIPTMILQPFVENAIWHGISPKKGKGEIKICFSKENEHLLCSVSDNGVGRQVARQKNRRFNEHESKALSITTKRLKLLHDKGEKAYFEILDLKDKKQQPTGTEVLIHLPLI